MRRVIADLLQFQYVWITLPELAGLLPLADSLFQAMLLSIPPSDLLAGRYTWHHADTREPDDGIIVKRSGDQTDRSIAIHGLPPDNKVFIQVRPRTRRLFKVAGVYDDALADFFDVTDEIQQRLARQFRTFSEELNEGWGRDYGPLEHDPERSVLRLMRYDAARPDSQLAGKWHTDQSDLTVHLYDSQPGQILRPEHGSEVNVPTRLGEGLVFASDSLTTRLMVPALKHAARHDPTVKSLRRVIVYFGHLKPVVG